MMEFGTVVVAHGAVTWALVGLIWVVQLVHYPQFAWVEPSRFAAFERDHQRRISWIVVPLMLSEVALAAGLVLLVGPGASRVIAWAGALLIVAIWASTFLLQVPCHAALSRGYDPSIHARLVRTNWVRTTAWTARGLLAVCLAFV